MLPRALVFDVFGTLVDWRTAISSAFEESGVPGDPDELADHWRAQLWPATADVNNGARPWMNFDELQLETLDEVLANRDAALDVVKRQRLVPAWHRLEPWPDACEGLEALRRERP